ncbi:MAG: hypothetical protein ACLPKT_04020 [Methylocella sp.]
MATPTTKITVTATDNELFIIASQWALSAEIGHIVSGNNNPVSYSVVPQSVLPKGDYTLILVGINWGGPAAFDVTLTPAGNYKWSSPSAPVDVVWTQAVPITV